ncbi:MAG: hypothetical protein U0Z26_08515 [Anaerolineales bacterium]
MPWSIEYVEQTKIIKTIYTEPITLEELKDAAQTNLMLAVEKQTGLFLADCSEFKLSGKVIDIYQLGLFLEGLSRKLDLPIKEAMIEPVNANNVSRDLHFYENVANNRMVYVRVFQEEELGIQWLLE